MPARTPRERGGAFVVGGPGGSAAVGHERVAVGSGRGPARDRVAHGGVAPPACGTVRGGDRGIGLHPEPSTTPGRSVPPATRSVERSAHDDDAHAGSPGPQPGRSPDHRRRRPLRRGRPAAATTRCVTLPRGRRRCRAARAVPRDTARVARHVVERSPTAAIPTVREQWTGDAVVVGMADRRTSATAPPSHLPALLYERLDEIGIDFTILYPSMTLGVPRGDRRRAVVGAVPRGEPLPRAPVRAVPRPLHRRRAGADEHARRRRSPKLEYAVRELGAKSRAHRRARTPPDRSRRLPARHVRHRQRRTTTTRSGRSASSSASRRWSTARCSQHRVTRSISNYVYNHIDGLAASARVAVQVAVPRRRHPPVPRAALRVPRGRRGVGVRAVRRPRRPLGEAQPRRDRRRSIPTGSTSTRCMALLRPSTATTRVTARLDELRDVLRAPGGAARAARRVRGRASIEHGRRPARPLRAELLLRLRGRRPAGGVGVPRRREPARRAAAPDLRLRHLALGRARHDRAGRRGLRAGRARA